MNNPESIIHCKNVSKTYPNQKIPSLKNISFDIYKNQKVGIIGANGSGKTTLLRIMLNLLVPDTGQIQIEGTADLEQAKKYLGFVSEYQQGLENFTPREILTFTGRMSGMSTTDIEQRVSELLQWLNLESRCDELLAGFSKGMRQRIFLATSLFHQPEILLLDEPMSGLDPPSQIEYRTLLQELIPYTIIYASHQLSEVEDICDRIMFLSNGELVDDFSRSDYPDDIYILQTEAGIAEILRQFPEIKIQKKRQFSGSFQIEFLTNPETFQLLLHQCNKHGIKIGHLKTRSILEELYHRYSS